MKAHLLVLGLLLVAWPVAHGRGLKQGLLGGSCGTVNPDDYCGCCADKGGTNTDDTTCSEFYAERCLDGGLCSTVNPDDFCQCCDDKGGKNGDSSCKKSYAKKCKPPGSQCSSVSPDSFCQCCDDKGGADSTDASCQSSYAAKCSLCSSVDPNDFCQCCDDKGGKNGDDSCKKSYAKKCAPPKPVGTTCATVNPKDFCKCCDGKGGQNGDASCESDYENKCKPTPPPGSTCSTVNPTDFCICCTNKGDGFDGDEACQKQFKNKCMLGSSCSTVTPGEQCACCAGKSSADKKADPWCKSNYASICTPVIGGSCATVSPGSNCQCCKDKNTDDRKADKWCADNYSSKCLVGSSCATVTPGQNCACCDSKSESDRADDDWCSQQYKSHCTLVGTSCSTVTPSDRCRCCDKKGKSNDDTWCKDNYQKECAAPPNNAKDFPYMAYIESPLGSCGGALVAPGYVLTAAQCVMFNGTVQDAAEVDVWVGGQWMTVETVLANNATVVDDEANMQALIGFADFEDIDMGELSGDVAMLALKKNSTAAPIALPVTNVPLAGNTTNQTAWETPQQFVLSEQVTVNETCNSGFNGTLCPVEEPEEMQHLCSKGDPVTMKVNGTLTQVGIASGESCENSWFVKLSEPTTLAQIVVWLKSRIPTNNSGLNDANLQWITTATDFIFNSTAGEIEL